MNAIPTGWGLGTKRFVTATLLACFTLVVGCSSDSDNPTASGGSLTDPAFSEVQPQINTFIDSVIVAFSAGLSSHNEVPITDGQIRKFYGPGIPGGTNESTYEYTTDGWHHITLAVNNDVTILGVNDSIQFKSGQTVQQASAGADVLDYRHHWALTPVDQSSDFTRLSGDIGYVFSGLNTTVANVAGSYGFAVHQHTLGAGATVTDNDFEFSSSASGVTISQPSSGIWGAGCPSSGSVSFSLAQTKLVTNGSTVDTTVTAWTGIVSFFGGSVGVSVSDGATTWNYSSTSCSPAL